MIRIAVLAWIGAAACGPSRRPVPPGAGSGSESPAPAAEDVEQMAMSPSGSCGVLTGGRAHCWGRWSGALIKLGQPADQLTDVAELRIGHDVLGEQHYVDHLCARDTHQRVQCWGNGHQGQLGPAGGDSVAAPLSIDGIPTVSQLALGAHHTCALTMAGEVLCWGSNEYGQLGIGKNAEIVRQPTAVALAGKVTQIVASYFDTCALTEDHEVYCWGENLRGEAGAPNPAASGGIRTAWTPYHAALASGARQLAAAFSTLCAVKLDGKIVCWGYLTDKLGPAFDSATQGEVPELDDATAVAVGASHGCAIRQDGGLWCWGTGAGGALGDGRGSDAWQPRQVSLPGSAVQVVATQRESCARLADRRWYCWGDNRNGAIAGRNEPPVLAPVLLDLSQVE
jgi:alpha-tubulin suppressor-like RCC1 family protein